MDVALLFPLALVATAVAGAVWVVGSRIEDRQVVRDSLKSLEGYDMESSTGNIRDDQLMAPLHERAIAPALSKLTGLGRRFTPTGYVDKVRQKFVLAGVQTPESVDRFIAFKTVSFPAGGVLFILILFFNVLPLQGIMQLIGAVAFGGGLAWGPDLALNHKVDARRAHIMRSMPDTLDLLTISVEAGLGFEQALDRVIDAVPGPLSDEFARMLGETRAGASRADSMRAMDERCDMPEIRSFVLAIIQADTFGVSIGRVLRAQAEEMRIKRRQLAQEKAQKAPVKMLIPMVFCIFPALFVVVLGPAALNISQQMG